MVEHAGSSAQRIRIGLTGLGVAFVLVLLGSAISDWGQQDSANSVQVSDANAATSEPLAEMGVTPGGSEVQANNSIAAP